MKVWRISTIPAMELTSSSPGRKNRGGVRAVLAPVSGFARSHRRYRAVSWPTSSRHVLPATRKAMTILRSL